MESLIVARLRLIGLVSELLMRYDPVRLPPEPPPVATSRPLPSPLTGSPRLPEPPFRRAVPTTRRIERVRVSIASPLKQIRAFGAHGQYAT